MKNLLIACALLTVVDCARDTDKIGKCDQETSNQFDRAISRPFTFADTNYTFPSDIASAQEFCRHSRDGISVARKILRSCVSGIQRQVANLLLSGINRSLRRECKDIHSMERLATHLKCFNGILDDLRNSMKQYTFDLRRVNRMHPDIKVFGLCCSYFDFDTAIRARTRSACDEQSNRFFSAMQDDYSGDVLDMLCSNAKNKRHSCKSLVWPESVLSDGSKHSLTFVNAFLVTLGNLGE